MHAARVFALIVLTVLPLSAQRPTFIVDAANGPGAQFIDLPTAVAAVPDGSVLLVRPGNYAAFSVSGKGLSIVGVRGDPTQVSLDGMSISNTSAAQTFLIESVIVDSLTLVSSIRDTHGAVIWDDVQSNGISAPLISVVNCDNFQLHQCSLAGLLSPVLSSPRPAIVEASNSTLQISKSDLQGLPTGDAVHLKLSRCVAFASSIVGGMSLSNPCPFGAPCFPGTINGGAAVTADQSTFIALGATVAGGSGGVGIAVTASNVFFEGSSPKGGAVAYTLAAGGTIQINPGSNPPRGEIRGLQQIGESIDFSLEGAANSLAALCFANEPTLTPFEPYALGSFLSSTVITVGPLFISSTGSSTWPFKIPASYPLGETYYWQFATLEPVTNRLWLTNSFPLHVDN